MLSCLYMEYYLKYEEWVKPFFAPPEWAFGVVWPILYVVMAVSFGWIFWKIFVKKEIPKKVSVPFFLNIVFNFAFTPVLFWLGDLTLALVDVFLVWVTIVWIMFSIKEYDKNVFYAQIPYLLWVSFATCLQLSIWFLN